MDETEVVRIVESTVSKKNENLLASMKSLLDDSILKRDETFACGHRRFPPQIKKLKNPYSRLLYVLLYVRCSAESAIVNLMVFLIYVVLANTKGKRLYDNKMI